MRSKNGPKRSLAAFLQGQGSDRFELGRSTQSGYPGLLPTADYLLMRVTTLHRNDASASPDASASITLPDAFTVYETALAWLDSRHEKEAAACLYCCTLDIVPADGTYPLREDLQPVRLILSGLGHTMSVLEQNPEIRGRVRQALDNALGPTIYLTQMALSTCANVKAA